MDKIYEQVVENKRYNIFPRKFVERLIQGNLNKPDVVKETRKQLREVYLMYKGLRKKHDAERIWGFLRANIPLESISVLDIGCGELPGYISVSQQHFKIKSYTAVDIAGELKFPDTVEFIIDDITEPKGKWLSRTYDVALFLNVIPIIERLERNSGNRLLKKIKARYILLSLPLYSLGGRKYIGHYWKKWYGENLDKKRIIAQHENKEMLILLKGSR
jgi:hypothetical protein